MQAGEFYRLVGEQSSPEDVVAIIDEEGNTFQVKGVIREQEPDAPGATFWIKADRN